MTALTRDFKETVAARVQQQPDFAKALFDKAATLCLNDEADMAKLILRNLIGNPPKRLGVSRPNIF
jgi:hypothetical protein